MTTPNSVRTDLTTLITGLYRQALADPAIGPDCDFFEAGGDSLAAFQITAGLQEELGVDVPVALVFSYPAPADLAAAVEADLAEGVR
ncbi:phosphopantetheine-binding protein [Micromonospora sp. NPDC049282]|uniref:phosphopantetheine-binding protein n=1 Tax=Micromonospora sp. NPDC049282 TaxID=3364269 RepID=UPI00371B2D8C